MQGSFMDKLKPFKLFREKAAKLLNSTFAQQMAKSTSISISWTDEGQVVSDKGPNQESIDAYLLTFRFFIQKNENISFNKMANSFKENIDDSELFDKFEEARAALNKFLDEKSHFNVNGVVSRRELMDTFIYGDLSHANDNKREKYLSWMKDEFMRELMRNEFRNIIGKVLIVINRVDKLCIEVIKKHGHA